MSRTLYACLHVAEFPAQALLRLRPDLRTDAVAVLAGCAPDETVCALNRAARLKGAVLGMTRLEAESIAGLHLLPRSTDSESAARVVLLECAARFAPRIEEASEGTASALVLDIAGMERLFGPPQKLAERLRTAVAECGFRASVAVSANFDVARMKAAVTRGVTVIPAGEEARVLENLPIATLPLAKEQEETLALWGVRTLGEFAALPENDLVVRLGRAAQHGHDLARGVASHTFQPTEPAFALEEFCEFEPAVEQIDSLLFIGARMIDCLTARAAARALALSVLTIRLKLEDSTWHERMIRPALPTIDRKFLLKLMQLEIGTHPPPSAVIALALSAEAGRSSHVQLGLFAPQMPEPSRLDVTLARLKALVGDGRVGSPVLEDTHKASGFRMKRFAVDAKASARMTEPQRMVLRRLRPPIFVNVALQAACPVAFSAGEQRYEVTAAYGPWRTSGCWWSSDEWDADEWDVLAVQRDGAETACLLVFDRLHRRWLWEACYD